MTWISARAEVERLAAGLISLGVVKSERVGLVGPNVPDWVIADYAIQHSGAVVVPIFVNSPAREIADILTRSKARVVLVYGDEALGRIREAMVEEVETVIALHRGDEELDRIMGRGALTRRGEAWLARDPQALSDRLAELGATDVATVVFTSGTGGRPKGVILTHHNLLWSASASVAAIGPRSREITLSYLPLAHAFERVVTTVVPLVVENDRWTCWFVETLEGLPSALRSVRPTILIAVPVVWARMQEKVQTELNSRRPLMRSVTARLLAAGEKRLQHRDQGLRLPLTTAFGGAAAVLAGRRILDRLGLDRCWYAVSGAAALPERTQRFFQAIGLPLHQGWGLTETSALCTVQRPHDLEAGSVGLPIDGVEIRLSDDGEVLVRGPNVFPGYEGEPDFETVDEDGFFHTGDLGEITEDGKLRIIDRLGDVIVTAGGRKVFPRPIEEQLVGDSLISEAMVLGEGRPYLTALISIDGGVASRIVGRIGDRPNELWEDPAVKLQVERTIGAVNRSLPDAAQLRRYALLPFGFPDEALTRTLKLKRRIVERMFAQLIESLYE